MCTTKSVLKCVINGKWTQRKETTRRIKNNTVRLNRKHKYKGMKYTSASGPSALGVDKVESNLE